MFNNQKFLTRGIESEIPSWLVHLMWHMALTMEIEEKDYLQVFKLTKTPVGQHIVHEQEQPPYRYELDVPCDDAVDAKVFVIDDLTHSTMLLAEEYLCKLRRRAFNRRYVPGRRRLALRGLRRSPDRNLRPLR